MLSENKRERVYAPEFDRVLILVLMEYALWVWRTAKQISMIKPVLILVLMEYALWGAFNRIFCFDRYES